MSLSFISMHYSRCLMRVKRVEWHRDEIHNCICIHCIYFIYTPPLILVPISFHSPHRVDVHQWTDRFFISSFLPSFFSFFFFFSSSSSSSSIIDEWNHRDIERRLQIIHHPTLQLEERERQRERETKREKTENENRERVKEKEWQWVTEREKQWVTVSQQSLFIV